MGGAASTGRRRKEDKTLDEIPLRTLSIQEFDNVFEKAAVPLNAVVELNNDFVCAVDKVKSIAAALAGAPLVEVTVKGSHVSFEVYKPGDQDEKTVMIMVSGGTTGKHVEDKELYRSTTGLNAKTGKNLLRAIDACNKSLTRLNLALALSSLTAEVKHDRLVAVQGTSPDGAAAAKKAIDHFNKALFKVKFNLAKASFETGIKQACMEVVDIIKKEANDALPVVEMDLAGLAKGSLTLDVTFDIDFDTLPTLARISWDSIMGPDGLVEVIKHIDAALAALLPEFEANQEAVMALPQDSSSLLDFASENGMGIMGAMRLPGKLHSNIDHFLQGRAAMNSLFQNLKDTCTELAKGLAGATKDAAQ